jgi:hypothetical protein
MDTVNGPQDAQLQMMKDLAAVNAAMGDMQEKLRQAVLDSFGALEKYVLPAVKEMSALLTAYNEAEARGKRKRSSHYARHYALSECGCGGFVRHGKCQRCGHVYY